MSIEQAAVGCLQLLVIFVLNDIKTELRGLRKDLKADVDKLDKEFKEHLKEHAAGRC